MRMAPEATWGANAGLGSARSFLEPLKAKYNMTYADLYTFASVVAVEKMGGPKIPWRSGDLFTYIYMHIYININTHTYKYTNMCMYTFKHT
jgi:catalase (peroxidase I)